MWRDSTTATVQKLLLMILLRLCINDIFINILLWIVFWFGFLCSHFSWDSAFSFLQEKIPEVSDGNPRPNKPASKKRLQGQISMHIFELRMLGVSANRKKKEWLWCFPAPLYRLYVHAVLLFCSRESGHSVVKKKNPKKQKQQQQQQNARISCVLITVHVGRRSRNQILKMRSKGFVTDPKRTGQVQFERNLLLVFGRLTVQFFSSDTSTMAHWQWLSDMKLPMDLTTQVIF